MKRFLITGFMSILFLHNLEAVRMITNFDIARWYLDSDLVLICSTDKIDTLFLSHHDFFTSDGSRLTYDMIREIYHIKTYSVIKICNNQHELIDSIYSQDFHINYAKTKQGEDTYNYRLNESGDTVGVDTLKTIIVDTDDYSDYSCLRLKNDKKYLVILSLTPNGYIIDYETEISDSILELITEIKNKGQAYFEGFSK